LRNAFFGEEYLLKNAAFIGCIFILKWITLLWSFQHIGHFTATIKNIKAHCYQWALMFFIVLS